MTIDYYARWEQNFRDEMQRIRELKGWTQTDLARILRDRYGLKFHQQTVQRIESGERPVRLNEAHLIAEALDARVSSMEATMAQDAKVLRYQVDRLRREAGNMASDLSEIISEYEETIAELFLSVQAPGVDLKKPDDATAWAIKFLWFAYEPYANLVNAWTQLTELSADEYTAWGRHAIDELADWHDIVKVPEHLQNVEPDELYELFPEAGIDGEHQ